MRLLCPIWLAALAWAAEIPPAPETPKKPVTDQYHGVSVTDDYRWLENFDDPAVKAWSDAQNQRARVYLDGLASRPAVKKRLEELRGEPSDRYRALIERGGRLFCLKVQPPRQQPLLISLAAPDDPASARVIVDPNALDATGSTAIDFYSPSLDGKHVAVSLSRNGSEDGVLHVFETATGRELNDAIPRVNGGTAGGSASWNADSSGFYYTRYPHPGERPAADLDFFQQVYFHRLGAPVSSDRYSLGRELPRIAEIALDTSGDGRYVLATVKNGDGGEFLFYVLLPEGRWKQVARLSDRIVGASWGPDNGLYLLSRNNAPMGRILRMAPPDFDLAQARVVALPGRESITDYVAVGKRLFVATIAGGPSQLRVLQPPDRLGKPLLIEPVSAIGQILGFGNGSLLFENESYTEPSAWFRYDPDAGMVTRTALAYRTSVNFSDCDVLRRSAISKDGTRVPMSILKKKTAKLDGANPTLLYGYGGYGVSETPAFSVRTRLWLDHGGIFVVANLRGGAEYGESWHEQGRLTKKQNVFDDFIACAEYLIKSKFTNPQKLAIEGGSNGGLLMGAALTQRPDLFRAVVSHVGIYDMLRVELSSNGAFNVTEFGTVKETDQFKALYAYSPYHHVTDGVEYPAVLFLTGDYDKRVDPMQSRKMMARLQAAGNARGPLLLRTSSHSGHGIGTPLEERIEQDADVFSFLFDQLGLE